MPSMHGLGVHHYMKKKKEQKTSYAIRSFIARVFGPTDHEKVVHIFDKFIAVVGLIGPIMTTPQIMNVWIHHQVEGLALATWSTYVITSAFWLIYGILHKERAIILVNIAWILSNLSIVVGILIFS